MSLLDKITSLFKGKELTPRAEYNRYQNMRLAEGGWWGERPYWPQHVRPIDKEINVSEWKTINSAANRLYWNYGAVTGAVNGFAQYVVGSSFSPVFLGQDKDWGRLAEEYLHEWCQIAYADGVTWQHGLIREVIARKRDGDIGTLFTESADGKTAQLQQIPWHAIGSRNQGDILKDGPYKGLRMTNGVVKNEAGRPVAYLLLGDTEEQDRWVSAQSMQLDMESLAPDQSRGFSAFAASIRDLRSVLNLNNNLRQAVEMATTIGLIIENQMGMADPTENAFAVDDYPGPRQSGLRVEERMAGTTMYFQAGAGEKISQLKNETPTPQTEAFIERLLRNAMLGAGFDPEFFWRPEGTGANTRLVVEKVNRNIARTQHLLATSCRRRLGYAVSKAIKAGALPKYRGENGGFLKWGVTKPAILTVDQGYFDAATLAAYRGGLTTMTDIVSASHGRTLEQHLDLKEKEALAIRERMERSGLSMDMFVTLTPNGNVSTGEPTL